MSKSRILVIGTTPDYIAHIYRNNPERALFVTDRLQRSAGQEIRPDDDSELVLDLKRTDHVIEAIRRHVAVRRISLSGITCFDCEWLSLAAELAQCFRLTYPGREAILICRDKRRTKQMWSGAGVRCPRSELVNSEAHALRFFNTVGNPVVLKPLTGSGSELTFCCHDKHDVVNAFRTIRDGLVLRRELPMYSQGFGAGSELEPAALLAEEYVSGREYSCDFIIDGSKATTIRIAKKLRREGHPFGTTLAYAVPAQLPGRLTAERLEANLVKAAGALGLTHAICMVDFIVSDDAVVFLELTPRIGGDCLPQVIRQSSGIDMLDLALDFAEGKTTLLPDSSDWRQLVGLRLFADKSGVMRKLDSSALLADNRVIEVFLKRQPGDRVVLPPEDYESWLLGHVTFCPDSDKNLRDQCTELRSKFHISMEQQYDQKLVGLRAQGGGIVEGARTIA